MKDYFSELIKHRDLLWLWSLRDIRVRYKQSLLGGLWAILQPLSLMVMFSLIFTYLVKVPTDNVPYPIFSYTALLPWTFLANSITLGTSSLVSNMNLVTKIYFPREILPLATIFATLVDILVASLVYIGLFIYYQYSVNWTIVLLPVLILIQFLLIVGLTIFLSAINVLPGCSLYRSLIYPALVLRNPDYLSCYSGPRAFSINLHA